MKLIKNKGGVYLKYDILASGFIDISRYLSVNEYKLIHRIGEYADEFGINAYLIGGFVRDFLLGRKTIDIDITVEGDGARFSRFLSRKLDCPYKCFEKFKTGKIFLKNKRNIDITSARSEYYEKPAALPQINFSLLQKDLYRRDFTINAMAIQINKSNFGRFIDFFHGFNDLKRGKIKILHNRSFEDDPTRILRAIRFEQRFGFKIESNTLNLLKQTIKNGIFNKLPGERLRDEILLILREKNPYKILKRGQNLKIWHEILDGLKFTNKTQEFFKNIYALIKKPIFKNIDLDCVYLMIFFYSLNLTKTYDIISRLKLKNEWKDKIILAKKNQKIIFNYLRNNRNNKIKIIKILEKFSREELFYFVLLNKDRIVFNLIENFLKKLKRIKLCITGDDLKLLGIKEGPIYKKIFDMVLDEKIRGKIKNKTQEIKFIRGNIIGKKI